MQQYRKNLGKVSLTAEGAWNLNNSYDILSIVYDEHTQHGFISRKAVPQGVDLYNKEYWMPLNVSGYADNNIIILSKKTSEANIQSYTLEEAIASIKSVGRRPGAILGFYNENADRLDIGGRWELWQFNDTNIYNWENVDSWQNLYYNYNKFMGWFKDENFLNKYAPFPEIGCYAFVGSEFNEATVYRCDNKYVWSNTTQHAWDYVKVIVDGNVTVGENGNWFNNGKDTGIHASVKGENGKTPVFREKDNIIQYSFDNINWITISDKVAAWFRWNATTGDTQANNVGRIQISRDNVTWISLSGDIINNLHISRYIRADETLPTSGIAEGTIYAKGPTYADGDTSHANPIYRIWVYAWKGNTLAWQDNGEFTSIAAGIVQETGNSETEVMSQKAITKELTDLNTDLFKSHKNISINYNGGCSLLDINNYLSPNDLGYYKMLIYVSDITTNQVVYTVGEGDNRLFLQINAGNFTFRCQKKDGSLFGQSLKGSIGWHIFEFILNEGNEQGHVLYIKCDNDYIAAIQDFIINDSSKFTIAALETGQVPAYIKLAAFQYENRTKGYLGNLDINDIFLKIEGKGNVEVGGQIIRNAEKYPEGLNKYKDDIRMSFNGSTSFVTYNNLQGITTTDGKIHFKFKVPNDIISNQILFAFGNQLMVTTLNGHLKLYNNAQIDPAISMEEYIGSIITLSIEKSIAIDSTIRFYINNSLVSSVIYRPNASEDINTLSIGSYNGGDGLFSAIDFYWIVKTDLEDNIEWIVNPYTIPSTSKDIGLYIANNNITSKSDNINYFLNIPQNIYITNGMQYNLYIENIIHGYEKLGYQLEVKTSDAQRKIRSMDRSIRFEESFVGNKTINLTLFDAQGNVLQSENRNLIITDIYKGIGQKQFLFCGDSTIDDATTGLYEHEGPEIVKQFYDNCETFKGFTPVMIGTKKNFPPYFHEGNTGQSSSWFISSASPFYIGGKLDFKAYMNEAGASGNIDFFVYQIGINDLKNESSPDSLINNIKTLISVLLTDYPSCKIIIGMPPSGCDADGWSLHFGDAARYEIFRNNMIEYQKLLLENFADGKYANNVYVCNAGHFVDRMYGFPYTEEKESSRISKKVFRHIDSVHPNKGGYDQIADAYFAMIKSLV